MHLGGPEMQSRLAKAGVNIEKLARRLVISSTDLVEDVKEAILSELRAQGSADSAKHARSVQKGPLARLSCMQRPFKCS